MKKHTFIKPAQSTAGLHYAENKLACSKNKKKSIFLYNVCRLSIKKELLVMIQKNAYEKHTVLLVEKEYTKNNYIVILLLTRTYCYV